MAVFNKFTNPTDDILIANDALKTSTSTTYVKLKEIQLLFSINQQSTYRIHFRLEHVSGTAYGKIYKNGVPISAEYTVAVNYVDIDVDILASDWVRNDLIQLYGHADGGASVHVYNFRIEGKQSDFINTLV